MSAERSSSPRWQRLGFALACVSAALAPGCDGCRGEKPYTPFGVTSALPSASAAPPSLPTDSAAPLPSAAPVKKAVFAPNGAQRWTLEGRELVSPDARVFEQGLVADFDADGHNEIATWTLPAPDAKDAAPGELWLYPESGPARKILDFPAFLPTGVSCSQIAAVSQSAPRTLIVDVRVTCSTQLVGRAPTRALAVVDPFAERGPRFGLRAADAAPGETLALELGTLDADGDGRDDYRLAGAVVLGRSAPELAASFLFVDRAAGVSRDAREPVKSLVELLKKDSARALKKKTADAALKNVELARRTLASLCAEGGTPRVFDWNGAPLNCGSLIDVVDRLATTEISAQLALGNFRGALGAWGRDGWYFGKMRAATASQLEKELNKRIPTRAASRTVLGARPKSVRAPGLSPLGFQADGALLVITDSGLYRLAADGSREEALPADANLTPWSLDAVTAAGAHFIGVSYSCNRSETQLLLSGASNEPQTVELLAPRPGVCAGAPFDEGFVPTPVALSARVQALIGGALVGERGTGAPPSGSALSPNGAHLAIPTKLGLLLDGTSSELWKIDGWGPETKSGCVADDSGRRAACVRAGRAELYLRAE